jgi:hypothetical protein
MAEYIAGVFKRPRQGEVIAKLVTPETVRFDEIVELLYETVEGKSLDGVIDTLRHWLEPEQAARAALKFVLTLAEKQQAKERRFGLTQ